MRILIVKTSSMGDVVHALPLASDLARACQQPQIDWVVEEAFAAIPRLHPAIARVVTVALRRWRRTPSSALCWRELLAARAQLRSVRYDAVLDCQGLLKSALIARSARGPVAGFDTGSAREAAASWLYHRRVEVDRRLHAVERNRRLGALALGYTPAGQPDFGLRRPQLSALPAAQPAVDGDGEYALLLTNASRASKLWASENWRAVEQWLAGQGIVSLLPWGSAAEKESTDARAVGMRAARVPPRTPIEQLVGTIARARIVIGLDTGLSHLAAAVGVPCVGIFCDYDPALVGLRGSAAVASLGGVLQPPSAGEVIEAARRLLAADPAGGA